jgi:hypothetical protein
MQRTVDGTRALIDLFWEEPREWNGDKFGYQLNCTISQQGTDPNQYVNGTLKGSQRQFSFAVRSGRISCLVFAMNDQHLMGPPSSAVEIDGSGRLKGDDFFFKRENFCAGCWRLEICQFSLSTLCRYLRGKEIRLYVQF